MPRHVVVDGSNLATEGRSLPSLKQLNEAVNVFIAEHPTDIITVVVDATFGHRIDTKEVADFEAAIEHNELVAPPAGAIGRGDAFVLSIANKVNATILTNDSYQEFHPEYPWLFDEGRLIGGKPVPNVGWVFVGRTPVRGPVSRRATRESKAKKGPAVDGRKASKAASQPMPVPTAPPPGAVLAPPREPGDGSGGGRGRRGRGQKSAAVAAAQAAAPVVAAAAKAAAAAPAGGSGGHVNAVLPFLTFVEMHPVGTSVNAIVETYSSHGAYVTLGDVRGYVPLRLMADPPPRSAREEMKIGESVTLVVVSYAPSRRSIDLAVPALAASAIAGNVPEPAPQVRGRRVKSDASEADASTGGDAATDGVSPAPAATRSRSTSAATSGSEAKPARRSTKKQQPATEHAASPDAASSAPGTARARPTRSRQRAAVGGADPIAADAGVGAQPDGGSPATSAAGAVTPAPPTQAPAQKAAAKKATAKKAPAKKAPATKATATKPAATRASAAEASAAKVAATTPAATTRAAKAAGAKPAGSDKTAATTRAQAKKAAATTDSSGSAASPDGRGETPTGRAATKPAASKKAAPKPAAPKSAASSATKAPAERADGEGAAPSPRAAKAKAAPRAKKAAAADAGEG